MSNKLARQGVQWTIVGALAGIAALFPGVIAIFVSHNDATATKPAQQSATSPKSALALPGTTTGTSAQATGEPADRSDYLADLVPITWDWPAQEGKKGPTPIDGIVYAHGLSEADCFGHSGPFTYEYNLGRKYTTFKTVVGIADQTPTDFTGQFEFFVDGQSRGVTKAERGHTSDVEISVRNGLVLKIVVSTLTGGDCGSPHPIGPSLGDPVLTS